MKSPQLHARGGVTAQRAWIPALLLALAFTLAPPRSDADRSVYQGRRGIVVRGEEGAAAVGRYGQRGVAVGDEGAARWGPRGGVAVGEEGAVAVGRYGRGVAVYEDNDAWKVAAGVATGIAVGTLLRQPPAAYTTVMVGGTSYYYSSGTYYLRVANGGQVVYQVVGPPTGAIIATLPGGCTTRFQGGVSYSVCGGTYYMRVSTGYQVVVLH